MMFFSNKFRLHLIKIKFQKKKLAYHKFSFKFIVPAQPIKCFLKSVSLQSFYPKFYLMLQSINQSKSQFKFTNKAHYVNEYIPCQNVLTEQELKTYHQVLQFSNLAVKKQIDVRNIKIYEQDHIHEIYTKNQNKDLPHMLMIHGFGGTCLTFTRLFQKLYPHYQAHSIDVFGNGYSSRGNWKDDFTAQQAQHYFIDSIQQWRKALKIQKLELVGHSFGGYLSTLYAKKYPQRVIRLVLLSPAGFTHKSQQQINQLSFYEKCKMKIGRFFYNLNIKPSSVFKNSYFGNLLLHFQYGIRRNLQGRQKELQKAYYQNLLKTENTSQHGLYILFKWPLIPVKGSIMQILKSENFDFKTEVYYGDDDWMQQATGAHKKIINHFNSQQLIYQKISNSCHQVMVKNAQQTVTKLIRFKVQHNTNQ